jgi:hypothetical protein
MSFTSSGSCDDVYQSQEDIGQACKLVCVDVMGDRMARTYGSGLEGQREPRARWLTVYAQWNE